MTGPATSTSDWPLHRRRRVEVDETSHPLGLPVGRAGDHHAAVAVADQDHVAQVLEAQHGGDVGDVPLEVDPLVQQVGPLTEPGERRGVDVVALGAQEAGHPLVAPATVPTPVDQHVGRHGATSLSFSGPLARARRSQLVAGTRTRV